MKIKCENLQFESVWCPSCGAPMALKDKTDAWMSKADGGSIYVAKTVYTCQDCDVSAEVVWTWKPKKEKIPNQTIIQKTAIKT